VPDTPQWSVVDVGATAGRDYSLVSTGSKSLPETSAVRQWESYLAMDTQSIGRRLKEARERRYPTVEAAATAMGLVYSSYASHESTIRGLLSGKLPMATRWHRAARMQPRQTFHLSTRRNCSDNRDHFSIDPRPETRDPRPETRELFQGCRKRMWVQNLRCDAALSPAALVRWRWVHFRLSESRQLM
jgi:hypothetical protein